MTFLMSDVQLSPNRLAPKPLPDNLRSVQPGGGKCYQVELAWGRCRRWWLKTFRPGYVQRMADLRTGSTDGAFHEVLDPRDVKFCRNLCTARWDEADDPFRWRDRLPFARWGLAELQLMGWPLLAVTIALTMLAWSPWPAVAWTAIVPAAMLAIVVYFFRDPPRRIPGQSDVLVAPADGKVVEITHLEHDEFIDGPAVRIGIFLSLFNVHINRAPSECRAIELRYSPGLFLNAMDPQSAIRNESLWIGLEEEAPPHRRLVVRQISGLVARRIVCELAPGDVVSRGHKFGMIKLGSRTELYFPAGEDLQIEAELGQKVLGGETILARYGKGRKDEG